MNKLLIRDSLITAFDNLPGRAAHDLVLPISRSNFNFNSIDVNEYRESGVAFILFENQETLRGVLIQRSEYDGTHSGQMAFPGGKKEQLDTDLMQTAIRECNEEIGVELFAHQLIGELTEVIIPVSKFKIAPFVFYLQNEPDFIPDPREVQEVITFDIKELIKEEVIQYRDIHTSKNVKLKNVPYFDIEGRTVWGATALMLSEFREILIRII